MRAIGSDLRMDYTAVGQTTHLAARMEQLATPGTILLTAETLRLVEGLVHFGPLAPHRSKVWPRPWKCSSSSAQGPFAVACKRPRLAG